MGKLRSTTEANIPIERKQHGLGIQTAIQTAVKIARRLGMVHQQLARVISTLISTITGFLDYSKPGFNGLNSHLKESS